MPTFPVMGKPLVSVLQTFFEPTDVAEQQKKAEHLAAIQKAQNLAERAKESRHE